MSQQPDLTNESERRGVTDVDLSSYAVPEILAPAGGKAQFFAALNAGADAVYLGLKEFNARSRAENFTLEDLRMLVPLARDHGMKVLVTLNILIKEHELPSLINLLSELQWLGIEAVIVQDLAVAQLVRDHFPNIRLHASTQMAIHNLAGVIQAQKLGFRRVVMARELTALELRTIRRKLPHDAMELEAFCHGSLCYSYSGLCFFSGAEDARSGNRGECAYTCRKPYRILNEPGHGFLFSMKDLNTSKDLDKLIRAGIDTLKIEGRKKDAQYVATTVGVYRQRLNELFGRQTGRQPKGEAVAYDWDNAMNFSFHRETTNLFLRGRYVENVIDLDNPTHKGLAIGRVATVEGRHVKFHTLEPLERFDGIRIDSTTAHFHALPQHGAEPVADFEQSRDRFHNQVCQFSLRDFFVGNKRAFRAAANDEVTLKVPEELKLPAPGAIIYKVRSNELKRLTATLSEPPALARLRPLRQVAIHITCVAQEESIALTIAAGLVADSDGTASLAPEKIICSVTESLAAQQPRQRSSLGQDLEDLFAIMGDAGVMAAPLTIAGDLNWFVPRKHLKELKQTFASHLVTAIAAATEQSQTRALAHWRSNRRALASDGSLATEEASFSIKFDRIDYLPAIVKFWTTTRNFKIDELVFEPKRSALGGTSPQEVLTLLTEAAQLLQCQIRLALPTVIRAFDEPLLKPWLKLFAASPYANYEAGNLGVLPLLAAAGCLTGSYTLASDFMLFGMNTVAISQLQAQGFSEAMLSLEDDLTNIEAKLANWPQGIVPRVLLYKDTPLFIAESCSLTALHNGCPTAAVCGYRTLEIANDEGEQFEVVHESCKSIVVGKKAFGVSQYRERLMALGVKRFRVDLLTRSYDEEAIGQILTGVNRGAVIAETHTANFTRTLL